MWYFFKKLAVALRGAMWRYFFQKMQNTYFFKKPAVALCGANFVKKCKNLVLFQKTRCGAIVALFFSKLTNLVLFEKTRCGAMWRYVALCGAIFSKKCKIQTFSKNPLRRYFFLNIANIWYFFKKLAVALLWRYFFKTHKFGTF